MIDCIRMTETRQLMLIKLLYIVCVLRTAISLEDERSLSATVTNRLDETCPLCYKHLQPDIYHNVTYTSNHRMPLDPINNSYTPQLLTTTPIADSSNKSRLANPILDEANSRSIYASLMKILQQLKNQMKNTSQESGELGEFAEAETVDAPIIINQLRRSDHDWSLKNELSNEKRFNRDTTKQRSKEKRRSRYDSLPAVTFSNSIPDDNQQETSTISKSSQLNINFDDNNNGNSMNSKKSSSYSKYLGPTIDVTTSKLPSDRKLNQQPNMDNNWYPNDDYSPSLRPSDELGLSKQELQPLDSPMPVYTTPGSEYLPSPSTLAPVNDNPNVYRPFKSSYSFPLPETKPSLDQALRETTTIATTTTENPEPTILLVRKQRNHGPYKKNKSASNHKSYASPRDTIHLAHRPANFDTNLPYEHDDPEVAQSIKSSSNFGEFGDELFRPKLTNHPIFLQQLDSRPSTAHSPNHYTGQYLQPQPSANHKVYYTLTSIPQTDIVKTMPATAASHLKSVLGTRSQRDLLNQPQTIQITSVPGNGALMRVNAANLGGSFGSGLDLPAFPGLSGLPGFPGRQVLMVNSDRRLDWSWIIWPMAVVVALPLVLSALFVPVFLKSIIIFIQILQSLGLVMPPSGLAHHFTSGASNLTSLN